MAGRLQDILHFEIFKGVDSRWRWKLKSGSSSRTAFVLAVSPGSWNRQWDCENDAWQARDIMESWVKHNNASASLIFNGGYITDRQIKSAGPSYLQQDANE